jgi:hypothetical protein
VALAETHEIKRYTYYVFSSRNALADTTLLFYDATSYIGSAFFYETTDALPAAEKFPSGVIGLHYHRTDLPILIDVLRNESPVYLVYDGPLNSRISTSQEPVGEYEAAILAAASP